MTVDISANKLYELIGNGLVDEKSFLEIGRISLITRCKFHTDFVIDTTKTKANLEGKDLYNCGNIPLFVDELQYTTKSDLYELSRKNRDTYEKENRPRTQ